MQEQAESAHPNLSPTRDQGDLTPLVTFVTALSCLFPWCTRSRMASTALGVSKSSANAAFTAPLVLVSLGKNKESHVG
jgi:predicted membrane-bound dolichyl-phosphate-mannose-protein mannosyltransferase